MGERVKPEEYDFTNERMDFVAMIGYEYGLLCQATGKYYDTIDIMARIRKAALSYEFVIDEPDSDDWSINTGKAREFAEQKAKEIHDDISSKKEV